MTQSRSDVEAEAAREASLPDIAAREAVVSFPVVGIGASAGGLSAFEAFFSAMPVDTEIGMAFVLVQHLAPDHKSILSDLVKRYTRMQVFEVEDGMKVEPNCAYIIPPNRDMAFVNGALELSHPAAPRGQRLPIDFFFRSLAHDQREQAVCIVLSGTGSDGTLGVRAVKGEGGMAMAQNPESTEYDGMPRNAIATGLVDYVLPPAEMPAQLIAYAAHPTGRARRSSGIAQSRATSDALEKVFALLRAETGHDFSQYKANTIARRIERRMAVQQLTELDDYARYLTNAPAEVAALFRDLLIGVTSFFRDPDAFAALESEVIPELFADKPASATVRVWVPGCSTGEEAYSIAMLLREKIEERKQGLKVQIFATDLDDRAIEVARSGVYPASIARDLSPERLLRHFLELDDGSYRVQKGVRDLLIFSEQDVTKDPPFSKLDLISCRNLLIYMGAALQKKIVPLFHYALNPGGALFLGTSETVGELVHLFAPIDRKAKIYRRAEIVSGTDRPALGRVEGLPPEKTAASSSRKRPGDSKPPLRELTERTLLDEAPVAALVDDRGELLYLHGHTGKYLEPAPGEMGVSILKMAREGLRRELTSALHQAALRKERVVRRELRVKTDGNFTTIDLTVRPVPERISAGLEERLFLVMFAPTAPLGHAISEKIASLDAGQLDAGRPDAGQAESEHPGKSATAIEGGRGAPESRIVALMQELRTKDDYLEASQEEMQTANEELKSSNEELQSTNEELQSTNEELETSKEELQSVNEELATVNAELQTKVADLSRVNNDMNNLLAGTGIGTVFVDQQLHIQRFTPSITQFINLIPTDIGRPLGHIVSNLVGYDRLVLDAQEVLDMLSPRELEVQTSSGAWYLLRIRPYRTTENVVEGVVITFTEVTAIKNAQAAQKESDALRNLAGVVRDALDAITVQDLEGRILAWNPGAVRMYGWTEAEAVSMNIRAVTPEGLRDDALAVVQRLSRAEVLQPYRTQRLARDGRVVEVAMTATALVNGAGTVYALSTTERGIAD